MSFPEGWGVRASSRSWFVYYHRVLHSIYSFPHSSWLIKRIESLFAKWREWIAPNQLDNLYWMYVACYRRFWRVVLTYLKMGLTSRFVHLFVICIIVYGRFGDTSNLGMGSWAKTLWQRTAIPPICRRMQVLCASQHEVALLLFAASQSHISPSLAI